MNILIIISKNDKSLAQCKAKILAVKAGSFILCPIHAGLDQAVDEIKQFILTRTKAGCDVVRFSRRLLEHSLKVKDEYLQFISDLGNKTIVGTTTLKEYFRYHNEKYSLWWLSLVYEKSPGKTDTFLHVVKVSLLDVLAREYRCGQIWINEEGPDAMYSQVLSGLKDIEIHAYARKVRLPGIFETAGLFIRESLRVLRYFFYLWAVRVEVERQPKSVIPAGIRRCAVTLFPYFDQKQLANGKFATKAYGPLQDVLERNPLKPVMWLAMHTKIEPYSWKESFRLAGRVKSVTDRFFSVDDFISSIDVFRIDMDFLKLLMRFLRIFSRLSSVTTMGLSSGQTVNLWPLLREDFISSFAGKVAVVNLHHLRMFDNICKVLPQDCEIFHFAEMHGWERALVMAAKTRGGIKVIAIQHAHVPQLLINYFDHPSDLRSEDMVLNVPQPDVLASVGDVIQGYFRKQGWPESKLSVIGGFRFASLLGMDEMQAISGQGPQVLVAAFSICYNENREMLTLLQRAFNDGGQGIKILVKSHPAESVEKMAVKEGIGLNANVFAFSDRPLEEVVPGSIGMFACSTSSIFYAMACRKPVIVPCLFDSIDLCPLTNLYAYERRIESCDELKSAVKDICDGRIDASRLEKYWVDLRREYLALDKDLGQHFEKISAILK